MQILADVCVHTDLVEALNAAGFNIVKASEKGFSTAPDDEIYRYAQRQKYVLLTCDKDFGNIVRFDIKKSSGIVIVYVEGMSKYEIIAKTRNFFEKHKHQKLSDKLHLIEHDGTRVWPH